MKQVDFRGRLLRDVLNCVELHADENEQKVTRLFCCTRYDPHGTRYWVVVAFFKTDETPPC